MSEWLKSPDAKPVDNEAVLFYKKGHDIVIAFYKDGLGWSYGDSEYIDPDYWTFLPDTKGLE